MKIKVSKATKNQLNWMVAKAQGIEVIYHDDGITKYVVWNVPPYARCSVEQMEHYCEMVRNPDGR